MDENRIEETLRKSWSPEPPDGMRERVLRRARREMPRARAGVLGLPRWQAALVAVSLAVVLLSGLSDHARQQRLAAISCQSPERAVRVAAYPQTLGRMHSEISRFLGRDIN